MDPSEVQIDVSAGSVAVHVHLRGKGASDESLARLQAACAIADTALPPCPSPTLAFAEPPLPQHFLLCVPLSSILSQWRQQLPPVPRASAPEGLRSRGPPLPGSRGPRRYVTPSHLPPSSALLYPALRPGLLYVMRQSAAPPAASNPRPLTREL